MSGKLWRKKRGKEKMRSGQVSGKEICDEIRCKTRRRCVLDLGVIHVV